MIRPIIISIFLGLSASIMAEPTDETEIEAKISAVGGDGNSKIYIATDQGRITLRIPNKNLYDSCEKYLLMKMEKGYAKVGFSGIFGANGQCNIFIHDALSFLLQH